MYQRPSFFVLIILAFAGFGFVYRMITNPMGLLNQLLMVAVFAVIAYAIFKLVISRKLGGQSTAFKKAARESKKRYETTRSKPKFNVFQQKTKSRVKVQPIKRKNNHNLTVIEGKKGKRKNRASF